jgi:hypothetical protein
MEALRSSRAVHDNYIDAASLDAPLNGVLNKVPCGVIGVAAYLGPLHLISQSTIHALTVCSTIETQEDPLCA